MAGYSHRPGAGAGGVADAAGYAHPGGCPEPARLLLGRRATSRHIRPLERAATRRISHDLGRAAVRPDGTLAGRDRRADPVCADVAHHAFADPACDRSAQSGAKRKLLLARLADRSYAISAAGWELSAAGPGLASRAVGCAGRTDAAGLRLDLLVVLFVDCWLYAVEPGGRAGAGPVRQIPGCHISAGVLRDPGRGYLFPDGARRIPVPDRWSAVGRLDGAATEQGGRA